VDRRGRGRHTTTASTLFPLDSGGELVDTPGVRELSIRHVKREELAECFLELRPHLGRCRFTSCSHIPEPGCALKAAVDEGAVARERYESYRRLYAELTP
jgi:ribosome biogenesis GTPase